jgi:tetratricopeptide (TPR) repeat protein
LHFGGEYFVNFKAMKVICLLIIICCTAIASAQEKRSDGRKLYQAGEQAYNNGKYADALATLTECLQVDPGYAEAYLTRAAVREQLKDLQGAHTDYNIYLALHPNQADALFSRATLRYRIGMYSQAREDLIKMLTLPPGETTTVYFRLSASPTGTNQITTAQSHIKPQLYNYLGLVETKLGNYSTAVHWLDSAISLEKREPDYYVNRALAKEALHDTTAVADYNMALAINPDHAIALHNMAVMKRSLGDRDAAMDQLEKAIESDSSMLYPYLERAYQRMEGGYYKGALEDYTRALEINDRDPEIWLSRGIAKEKSNDLKGAFSDYTQAIERNEKFEKAWLNRGNVLSKQGRYKEASEDYTAAIAYKPDYAYAYYNRAIAWSKLKQPAAACTDLKKAEALGHPIGEKMMEDICP